MDDAVTLAVAVARLEAWLLGGGRAEVVYEPRWTDPACPVVRLHRGGHVTHEGTGFQAGRRSTLAAAVTAAVDAAEGRVSRPPSLI